MKASQVGILIAVLLGGVFGLTFLKEYMRKPVERAVTPKTDLRGQPLKPTEMVAVWDVADLDPFSTKRKYQDGEVEKGVKGHYDFWVTNSNPEPVAVRLLGQSCTCFDLKLGIVPTKELVDARAAALPRQAVVAATLGILGSPELAILASIPDVSNAVQWHPLVYVKDSTPPPVMVPAAESADVPQVAVVRFDWLVQTVKATRLRAEVQHQFGKNVETTVFDVPMSVVPPVQVAPTVLQFGDLNYNEQHEQGFLIWSATRPSLNVKVELATPDPCIEIGPLIPLTEKEMHDLPPLLLAGQKIEQMTRMRCGYKVKVSVSERKGDHQMELGLLGRRLLVKRADGGPDDDTVVIVTAAVRGAIRVGEASDKDHIDLGTFRADRGVEKNIVITSSDPSVQLRVERKTPDSLQVELKEQPGGLGQKRWVLHVEAAPTTFSGTLPLDSAIFLQADGTPPRSIRIPVMGMATH